jgi:hypothetical protein
LIPVFIKYPSLHRHAEEEFELKTEVEKTGHCIGKDEPLKQ